MPLYRKKTLTEMFQWTGQPQEEWPDWARQLCNEHRIALGPVRNADYLILRTGEGEMRCSKGDWIARDNRGLPYPIDEAVQRDTYEEAQEV
jgi:hypothetical protein